MGLLINGDNALANDHTITKCHDTCPWLKLGVDNKTRHQAGMEGADITQGVPNILNGRFGGYFFADRSHLDDPDRQSVC